MPQVDACLWWTSFALRRRLLSTASDYSMRHKRLQEGNSTRSASVKPFHPSRSVSTDLNWRSSVPLKYLGVLYGRYPAGWCTKSELDSSRLHDTARTMHCRLSDRQWAYSSWLVSIQPPLGQMLILRWTKHLNLLILLLILRYNFIVGNLSDVNCETILRNTVRGLSKETPFRAFYTRVHCQWIWGNRLRIGWTSECLRVSKAGPGKGQL